MSAKLKIQLDICRNQRRELGEQLTNLYTAIHALSPHGPHFLLAMESIGLELECGMLREVMKEIEDEHP